MYTRINWSSLLSSENRSKDDAIEAGIGASSWVADDFYIQVV